MTQIIDVNDNVKRIVDAIRFEMIGMNKDELKYFLRDVQFEVNYWQMMIKKD